MDIHPVTLAYPKWKCSFDLETELLLPQKRLPSFNITDSNQDPKPDPQQVHRGLLLPDLSFHSSDDNFRNY